MKRFINSVIIFVLTFSGPLMVVTAWVWLWIHATWQAAVYSLLCLSAAVLFRQGPRMADRYIRWRMRAAKARAARLEAGLT